MINNSQQRRIYDTIEDAYKSILNHAVKYNQTKIMPMESFSNLLSTTLNSSSNLSHVFINNSQWKYIPKPRITAAPTFVKQNAKTNVTLKEYVDISDAFNDWLNTYIQMQNLNPSAVDHNKEFLQKEFVKKFINGGMVMGGLQWKVLHST